jgi:hypothetical protein
MGTDADDILSALTLLNGGASSTLGEDLKCIYPIPVDDKFDAVLARLSRAAARSAWSK